MNKTLLAMMLAGTMVTIWSYADLFGTGTNQFSMDFVDVGNPGNQWDVHIPDVPGHPYYDGGHGFGRVEYNYRIGKYEVTLGQYKKAFAEYGTYTLSDYWGLGESGPAIMVTWLDMARFCNYLTSGDASAGAYQFSSSSELSAVDRNAAVESYGTVYVLPNEDEWYKAAYFKSDGSGYTSFAAGDSAPTAGSGGENYLLVNSSPWQVGYGGLLENNGTFDMGGNVIEMTESAWDGEWDFTSVPGQPGETRVIRGGAYYSDDGCLNSSCRSGYPPWLPNESIGFRVAAIPEPSSFILMTLIGGAGIIVRRHFPAF